VAKVTFAQSPNMRVEKLSDTDEHLNKDGRPSSDESDNESMAGRQKHAGSATAYNTQPGSPSSEGLILIFVFVFCVLIIIVQLFPRRLHYICHYTCSICLSTCPSHINCQLENGTSYNVQTLASGHPHEE